MKNNKGFTIIEILVVIGIIAVLTVVIFPSVNNIRAKNRDAEKIADIAAIQIGLALFRSATSTYVYPRTLNDLLPKKYVTPESLVTPDGKSYLYIPLARKSDPDTINPKCVYYHLGAQLELPNAQIDLNDTFNSKDADSLPSIYKYCNSGTTSGIDTSLPNMYQVHP